MRQIPDASSASLVSFVQDSVAEGSVVPTDGWLGYLPVESKGFLHQISYLKGKQEAASELLPRVHLVISLLKRWLLGTHQGAVSHKHLDYYLDEFTFRFNLRKSRSRGKLFYRLAQQAVSIDPVTRHKIVHLARWNLPIKHNPLGRGESSGYPVATNLSTSGKRIDRWGTDPQNASIRRTCLYYVGRGLEPVLLP
jgi:transposase-like protein